MLVEHFVRMNQLKVKQLKVNSPENSKYVVFGI